MRIAIPLALAAAGALLLAASPDASAQSSAYINLMRTQNQQMMNRTRIYSSVRQRPGSSQS